MLASNGRTYSIKAHTLPSARGQGEPITGRISLDKDTHIVAAVLDTDESYYLVASDAGYGFVAKLGDLHAKNKAGKATLTLPTNAKVLAPVKVADPERSRAVVVSNEGRMLAFNVASLPQMAKGKGNKLISISSARAKDREEWVCSLATLLPEDLLCAHSGKRFMTFAEKELLDYVGERGRRGLKLPRGFQRIDQLEVKAGEGKPSS